jgi:L-ascorbate metabolism protein UlaG (beta-lactamase superfamily)
MNAMLDCDSDISLCWVGNDGWIIHHNDITLAFDLDLLDSYRTAESPVSVMELAPYLDYLFITHEHNDHFHDRTADALNRESSCRFILPESCLTKADSLNIPEERRVIARPGQPFSLDGIEIEPVRALHGHIKNSVYMGANLKDCGYILNLGGRRIYQPGDTVLLHEHLEMKNIDVLFISPTQHNTQVVNSLAMIESINPAFVFPQHYDTYPVDDQNYFWTRGYPDELYEALPDHLKPRYSKLAQGEIFEVKTS